MRALGGKKFVNRSNKLKAAQRSRLGVALLAMSVTLSGCTTVMGPGVDSQRLAKNEAPILIGVPVRDNRTPMESALACFGDQLIAQGGNRKVIAVGDVKDYTGKYSISEGNAITQGGSLMVYSALGKIGGTLAIAERFDPVIAERELGYTDRRQLGDGKVYDVNGNKVPWVPYFGGSITGSDYYIVGGITELNYNIRSAGAEVGVNNIGPKARVYTQSVAVDLRIVDSRSLEVVKTVSLTKQFSGYEVGANVFRFFGTDLFDINVGAKGQEPLQLGVRTALEEATMRLIGAVTKLDTAACMGQRLDTVPDLPADQLRGRALTGPVPAAAPEAVAVVTTGQSLNDVASTGAAPSGKLLQVAFEFGDVNLMGSAKSILDQVVQLLSSGPVELMIVGRDTENWDPAKRDALIDQRISAVTTALANRGISPGAIQILWRPDRADTSIHRDGPGLQELAKIKVSK